jgi:hypothetical protein
MKANYTDISIVLDRSGSMQSIRRDTIGGFNAFLQEQRAVPGAAAITLVQFDDQYEPVYQAMRLSDAPELTEETFVPRGSTALLDAIGRTINETGRRLAALPEPERPGKVVFVILTDGEENASREFDIQRINELIRQQREVYKWQFVFLGANQDAIASASRIGIQAGHALTYAANQAGAPAAMAAVSRNLASYRLEEAADLAFSEADREEQAEALRDS